MEKGNNEINAEKAEKYDAIVKCFARYSRDDIEYLKGGYHIFDTLDEVVNGSQRLR